MTHPIDTRLLHVLHQLRKANGNAVWAAGHGYRALVSGEAIPLSEYLIRKGWAAEVRDQNGQLQGLRITDEGKAWLDDLEHRQRKYPARD